jgi:hypothetical protein
MKRDVVSRRERERERERERGWKNSAIRAPERWPGQVTFPTVTLARIRYIQERILFLVTIVLVDDV